MTQTERLLERLNAEHGTALRLIGRYAQGENHGAYAVADASGAAFVLKWQATTELRSRLERARLVTERLVKLGVPAPRYVLIGSFPEGTTYWLQTALPGSPPADLRLSLEHARQLLDLNERQAEQALSSEQDWSGYVRRVVFAGESGWADTLRGYSPETRALLGRLERVTAGRENGVSRTGDLVHGDLALGNVLVVGEQVTGVVDWDAAGCGDRALDLSKLLFYSYENRSLRELLENWPMRELLWQHIMNISGPDALVVYLAYNILAQLDWSIRHHSPEAVAGWVATASLILADVDRTLNSTEGRPHRP